MQPLLAYFGVVRMQKQPEAEWTFYFSPWHKEKKSILRISNGHRLGGHYASPRWEVMGKGEDYAGYGAISLVARLMRVSDTPQNRRNILRHISDIMQLGLDWLEDEYTNGYSQTASASDDMQVELNDDFSLETLESIGCRCKRIYVEQEDGSRVPMTDENDQPVFIFSFGAGFRSNACASNFNTEQLHRDFGLYEVNSYTDKATYAMGAKISIKHTAHPLFPMLAFVNRKNKGEKECLWGELYQPAWNESFAKGQKNQYRGMFYTGGLNFSQLHRTLFGDRACICMMNGLTARKSVAEAGTAETLKKTYRKASVNEKGKLEYIEVPYKEDEMKLSQVLICADGLDAVCAYYAMRAISFDYAFLSEMETLMLHCVWKAGKPVYNAHDSAVVRKLAFERYLLFGSDAESRECAFLSCKADPYIKMGTLPDGLSAQFKVYRFGRMEKANSIRDFLTAYQMSHNENITYGGDVNRLLYSRIISAVPANPFTSKTTIKNGVEQTEYKLDTVCLWQLMAISGYCREVETDSSDLIGRFIHRDGCFIQEVDARSVVVAAQEVLKTFAGRVAADSEECRKMLNCVNLKRDLSDINATYLPSVVLDFRNGYGPKLDHFFFRNGALRITPAEIRFMPYNQLDFCIDRGEIQDFDFDMPDVSAGLPFRIYENKEYIERLQLLNAHRQDTANYTRTQVEDEERQLQQWAQVNRWKFDFSGRPVSEWWQPLQVIRCFANEDYEKEQELMRAGESFSEEDEKCLQARMANILYSLGRPLFRYRGGGSSYMPYITENRNSLNDRAEGGSGKSVFVNIFMGCAGKVYRINSRNLRPDSDIALSLDGFKFRQHRVVHWEDWPNGLKIDPLYNYVTSGFEYRFRFHDTMRVPLAESPGHVISSNFQQSYDDPSSSGRVVPTGFSHYFNRGDVRKNKPESKISAVMPGLRDDPEDMDISLRSQIAFIDAMAVQFCMNVDSRVLPPMGDLNERSQKKAMGDTFILWAKEFFSHDYVFLCPIDLKTIFSEYVELCDTSDDKKTKFSASTFRKKVQEYCADNGFVCNPDVCLSSETERRNRYMRVKAWCRTVYFDDENVWGPGRRKEIRELRQSQQCLFFVHSEAEAKKLTGEQVSELCKRYYLQPDPAPCMDPETGQPYQLTEEERTDWDIYMLKKQGNYTKANKLQSQREVAADASAAAATGEVAVKEELPF